MRAVGYSQPKVPQKRLRFDEFDVTESAPILTNGDSTEGESGSRVNGTNGEKADEPEDSAKS